MDDLKYKEMLNYIAYNYFMDYYNEKVEKKIEDKNIKFIGKKIALKVIINNDENINNNV